MLCSQVISLLSFYLKNTLNQNVKNLVSKHLENCPVCREKYMLLAEIFSDFEYAKEQINNMGLNIMNDKNAKQYILVKELSAYSDNELSDEESLKVKKYIVTNLSARKELTDIYSLRKLLKTCFNKSYSKVKEDFSKTIIKQLNLEQELKSDGSKLKIASILIFIVTLITTSLFYIISNLLV